MMTMTGLGESYTAAEQAKIAAAFARYGIPMTGVPVTDPAERQRMIAAISAAGCDSARAKSGGATDQAALDGQTVSWMLAMSSIGQNLLPNPTTAELALVNKLREGCKEYLRLSPGVPGPTTMDPLELPTTTKSPAVPPTTSEKLAQEETDKENAAKMTSGGFTVELSGTTLLIAGGVALAAYLAMSKKG